MSKHTPGPWHTTQAAQYKWKLDIMPPADLPTGSAMPVASNVSANDAALIAAAPDLLEALREIAAHLAAYGASGVVGAEVIARAAIAKAEGEQL